MQESGKVIHETFKNEVFQPILPQVLPQVAGIYLLKAIK